MASIQSLGVGSGLLTSDLVESIVAAERESTDLRLNAKRAEFDAKISAFGGVRASLDALQNTANALSSSEGFLSNTATSSNPAALTASAAATAEPGVHTVEVLSLARAHTLITPAYEDVDTVIGDGTLDIRFGTTTFDGGGVYSDFVENEETAGISIAISETNNTLSGIRDTINAADSNVTASIVNDGSGYILVLNNKETGADQSLEITVTEGTTPGLNALAFNASASTAGTNLTQTVAADDAAVNVDGILIRRSGNIIDEVIPGVTLNALSLNAGAPATLSIGQDTLAIEERMQAFVDAFNDTKALSDELTAFDEDSGTGSLLIGDATLRGVRNQMRRFVSSVVDDLTSNSLRTLADLGITTNQNAGFFLSFDSQTFRDALSDTPNDVVALLADASRASDPLLEVTNFQNATQAGNYDVEITRVASQGFVSGSSVPALSGPITIDADNDELSIGVDGGSAIAITLTAGSYADGNELAQEIQNQLNAQPNIKTTGNSISVSYDDSTQQLTLSSDRYGSSSQISIGSVDTATATTLGLVTADGTTTRGADIEGLINGVQGQGTGQFLALPLGPAPATAARLSGAESGEFPVVLDSSSTLRLTIDGTVSDEITLTPGSYNDGFALAAEISEQINADAKFSTDSLSVEVNFDPGQGRFVITTNTTGAQAEIVLTELGGDLEAQLGFQVGASATGVNEAKRPDEAAGLQIRVLGGDVGSRGTATVVRGVMNRLTGFLDTTLGSDGSFDNKVSLLEERLQDIDEESADFNDKMDSLEERLRFQFAAADALISQLNNTSSFLTQQLASLPGYSRDDG